MSCLLIICKILVSLGVLLFSGHVIAREQSVIYGPDDRRDVFFSHAPNSQELARSTAALIHRRKFGRGRDRSYHIPYFKTAEQRLNLCPNSVFAEQSSVSDCSGFLVAPDIIATSGHCFASGMLFRPCKNYHWVFDYKLGEDGRSPLAYISEDNVYSCLKVMKLAYNIKTGEDFALIKLKRKVVARLPLKLNRSGKDVAVGTPLILVGHPWGLPTKITDNAIVQGKSNARPQHFEANLDAFSGNSGSAVINAETGLVEGVFAGGKEDLFRSVKGNIHSCRLLNTCLDNGGHCSVEEEIRYEQVMKISLILPYL